MEYSLAELTACLFAREINDWDVVSVPGLLANVPLAAVGLAKALHAPNTFVYSPIGELAEIRLTGTTMDHAQSSGSLSAPTLDVIFDMNHHGDRAATFYGALQIDRYANINLVSIGADWQSPDLRGPGAAAGNSLNFAGKILIWTRVHDRRTFVANVDFVSTAGFGPRSRESLNLPSGGPGLIVTPLCCMRFNTVVEQMELLSTHEGITLQDIVDATAFEFYLPDPVPLTSAPTERELRCLRNEVDPLGLLRT